MTQKRRHSRKERDSPKLSQPSPAPGEGAAEQAVPVPGEWLTIGVRELKDQASEVLRRVREEAAQYVVTVRGEQQAVLRPLQESDMKQLEQQEARAALARLDGIARRVAREWAATETAAELLAADRR